MCGIFCVFTKNTTKESSEILLNTYERCKTQLNRRGPDYQSIRALKFQDYNFLFAASVLWLQGDDITPQPIETDVSIFVYNGNLYNAQIQRQKDTEIFLEALENSPDILLTLSEFHGPYSFLYLDKRNSKLYFCRDFYGRRSLLIGVNENNLLLTSVAGKSAGFECIELPAIGLFSYDLNTETIHLEPWKFKHKNFNSNLLQVKTLLKKDIIVNDKNYIDLIKPFFPPSIDDLLCFEHFNNPSLIKENEIFLSLLKNKSWNTNINILHELLSISVNKRIMAQPNFCVNCIGRRNLCLHATTGVLFSGGVDCTILALLADEFVDKRRPVDLINVAFNKEAPDRSTGLESLKELECLRPDRVWNFIKIDVEEEELNLERAQQICDLIYPRKTILDDSLGCALWFASRGKNSDYTSSCRVILVGMGADELFGGYTKHRAAFKSRGWAGIHELLDDDWQNIAHRNLARDDRVVSDHARHLCTPYLDENVVKFVQNLNCWEKTCPNKMVPQGFGEKILLRCLAHKIGLTNAARLIKRALQFGSRIANRKENANDISPRL